MIKANVEVITPVVAAAYLEKNQKNRKLSLGRVHYYADMMKNGQWELNGDAIRFSEDGRLLDGQHRLRACIAADMSFETMVMRGIEEKVFDTLDQGRIRSKGQVFEIASISNSGKVSSIINRFSYMYNHRATNLRMQSGINIKDAAYGVSSPRVLLDIYNSDPEYWQDIARKAKSLHSQLSVIPESVVGALIAHLNKTCGHELDSVIDFFRQLFFEEKTKMNVIRALRKKLINHALKTEIMDETTRLQLIRKTWDYYKAGRDCELLRWVKGKDEELPLS